MNEDQLTQQLEQTKEKLNKALRRAEGLKEKSKIYEQQYVDAKEREQRSGDLVMELMERQRELNVMLNRANIMLNRAHEAMALTSVEFNEMAKALPEPKKAEWSDRVSKINDLFKKTGIQDGDMLGLESSNPPPSLETDEIQRESKEAFGQAESIWSKKAKHEPKTVEAELLAEDHPACEPDEPQEPEIKVLEPEISGEDVVLSTRPKDRKPWWHRIA